MTRYYFFKTVRENGYIKLRALPGQTTYYGYRDQNHPVDESLNVQCSSAARHIQCAYGEGYVFAAKVEGSDARATKLPLYSRNDVNFYRLDEMTFPVWFLSGNGLVTYRDDSDRPAQDILDAFGEYRRTHMAGASAQQGPQDVTAETPSVSAATADGVFMRLANIGSDEVDAMAAYVNTERPLAPTLIKLSRLRDLMACGVAKFEFIKQNGDHRIAYGTRRADIINRCPNANRNEGRPQDGAHFNYYDLQRRDWRCFCVHDFVDVDVSFLAVSEEDIARMLPAI